MADKLVWRNGKQYRPLDESRKFQVKDGCGIWKTQTPLLDGARVLSKEAREEQFGKAECRTFSRNCDRPTTHAAGCHIGLPKSVGPKESKLKASGTLISYLEKAGGTSATSTSTPFTGEGASAKSISQTISIDNVKIKKAEADAEVEAVEEVEADEDDDSFHDAASSDESTESSEEEVETTEFFFSESYSLEASGVQDDDEDFVPDDEPCEDDAEAYGVIPDSTFSKYLDAMFERVINPFRRDFRKRTEKPKPFPGSLSTLFGFLLPRPELLLDDPELRKFALCPDAHAFAGSSMIFVDPEDTHHELLSGVSFVCQGLTKNGDKCRGKLRRDSPCPNFVFEKSDDGPRRVIKGCIYRCYDCRAWDAVGQKSRSVRTYENEFLSQLPRHLQSTFDWIHHEGSIYSSALALKVRSLATQGVKFATMEKASLKSIKTELLRRDASRGRLIAELKHSIFFKDLALPPKGFNCKSYLGEIAIRARHLTTLTVATINQQEPLWQSVLEKNAEGATAIGLDHFFPNGNKGTKHGARAVLNSADNYGRPCGSWATTNKSLKDPHVMKGLKKIDTASGRYVDDSGQIRDGESKIEVVFTDNVKADRATLNTIFTKAHVALDLFHFLKPIQECVKRGTRYFSSWVSAITSACYVFDSNDIERVRTVLKEQDVDKVDEKLKDSRFLKRRPDIRRYFTTASKFTETMDKMFLAFSKVGCFTKDILKVQETMKHKVQAVFQLPQSYFQILNTSKNGFDYRYLRGTNMIENLHRLMQAITTYRCGPELTHALFLSLLLSRSREISMRLLRQPLEPFVDDCVLLNELVAVQELLKELNCFYVVDPSNVTKPIKPEDYVVNHRIPLNSTTKAAGMDADKSKQVKKMKGNHQLDISPAHLQSENEKLLLKLLIRSNYQTFFSKACHHCLIDEEGNIRSKLYEVVFTEGFEKVFDSKTLCEHWNILVNQARAKEAEHIGPILNVKVSTDGIRCKEPLHFQRFFERYFEGITKNNLPDEIKLLQTASTVSTSSSTRSVPTIVPSISELPELAESATSVVEVEEALGGDISAANCSRYVPCDVCQRLLHKTDLEKECVFYQYSRSNAKVVRRHNESRTAAIRRQWLELKATQEGALLSSSTDIM